MTTMLHSEFDYDTSRLKRAIQHGEAKPTTRNHSQMTIFPLGLPLATRNSLARLSLETGEPMAEIIRQAIAKILDEGISGVERVTSKRAFVIFEKRAATAQEKANRAVSRAQAGVLARQERVAEKAAKLAQRAAKKAEKSEVVPVPTQPELSIPSETDQIMEPSEADNHQLDRPEPPTPQHIWVRGSNNRWGGYWRAPKGTRTV